MAVRAREDLTVELKELARIVQLLNAIELDTKAGVLLERLALFVQDESDAKVLIFTQSRDTQEYLRQRCLSRGTSTSSTDSRTHSRRMRPSRGSARVMDHSC